MSIRGKEINLLPYKVYFFLTIFYFLVSPLRTLGIFQALTLVKLFVPICLGFMVVFWLTKTDGKLYKDQMVIVIVLMFCQSLIIGAFRDNNYYYFVSDLFTLFAAGFTYSFSSVIKFPSVVLNKIFKNAANSLFVIGIFVVFIDYFFTYYFNMASYLSYGESYLLFPFGYYLFYKHKIRATVLFAVVFLGGRVGLILACLCSLAVYYLLSKNRKLSINALVALSLFLFFVNITMYSIKDYSPEEDTVLAPVLYKLQNYNYYHFKQNCDHDIGQFGAGRVAEIDGSLAKYSALSGFPYLFGGGAGFLYDIDDRTEGINATHNVHVSVINIVEKYGFPLSLLFYASWLKLLYRSYFLALSWGKHEVRKNLGVMCSFCVGMFFFSFTAFTVFIELFPWFFLGFINNIKRNEV